MKRLNQKLSDTQKTPPQNKYKRSTNRAKQTVAFHRHQDRHKAK